MCHTHDRPTVYIIIIITSRCCTCNSCWSFTTVLHHWVVIRSSDCNVQTRSTTTLYHIMYLNRGDKIGEWGRVKPIVIGTYISFSDGDEQLAVSNSQLIAVLYPEVKSISSFRSRSSKVNRFPTVSPTNTYSIPVYTRSLHYAYILLTIQFV